MQGLVAPVERQPQRGDRHQLEAVDAEAPQVGKPGDDARERAVELFDLQLVDDQVVCAGHLPAVIGPAEVRDGVGGAEGGELAHVIGGPGEGIGEPRDDHRPVGPRQAEPVQVPAHGHRGYLKSGHGMGHGYANALVGWTLAGNIARP